LPSPPDPAILDALLRASTKSDVRDVIADYPYEEINRAWRQLPPVQQAALQLVRYFNGTIFHDLTPADFRESDPL